MEKIIFWSITILCVWIISLLPITAEGETWGEILTDTEKAKLQDLVRRDVINEGNIDAFLDRFLRAPNREGAFDQALDGSFSAAAARELHGIKRRFADPRISSEALQKHYQEHGAVKGTLRIALSPVTIPIRSWSKIVGSEPGLGEYPLKVLIGAAVVILWGALILSKQTKYNYKAALSRLTIAISIIIFIVYSIIDGVVSGLTFVLYAVLFLGIQYLIICWILYYVILWVYHYVILSIYRGLKQQN